MAYKTIFRRKDSKSEKPISVAAVGRHLDLGMLYDCRNDSYIPGVYLWVMESIEKNKVVTERPQTVMNVSLSESLEEKAKLLQISSSLSLSLHAGLVKVSGSSSYLHDRSSSQRECRAAIQYHVMTRTEHLNLSQMGKKNSIHKLSATHVVTGVEYGAEALMVFSETVSSKVEKKSITGNLNAMLNKIPLLDISAEGKVQMTNEERKKVQNFSCTFYGDFELEENPTNFEQAVKVYRDLSKLLGTNKEKVVPKKFWLVPLAELMYFAPKLKHEVSEMSCIKLRAMMEELVNAEMLANDMAKYAESIKASDITRKMRKFTEQLQKFTLVLKDNLGSLLPEIRKGVEKEDKLEKMFALLEASPFSKTKMDTWLKERETEISIINSYIEDIRLVPDVYVIAPEDMDKVLYDPSNKSVWAFVFTSLGEEDSYMDSISVCLQDEQFTRMQSLPSDLLVKKTQPWYKSPEVSKVMRETLKLFCKGSADRQLSIISYINYPYDVGAAVRLYTNCHLDYVNYRNKYEPEVVAVDSDSVTLRRSVKGNALAVSYRKAGSEDEEDRKLTWPPGQDIQEISDLQPGTLYHFLFGKHNCKLQIQTKPGDEE